MAYLKRNGISAAFYKAVERITRDMEEENYRKSIVPDVLHEIELSEQREARYTHAYQISILVPAYETEPAFLRAMIESVLAQTYEKWELCIADGSESNLVEDTVAEYRDERIVYRRLFENGGIAANTNEALAMAHGEYVGLLDHDDELAPSALYEVMQVLDENLIADGSHISNRIMAVYTDEDKVDATGTHFFDPHYKPGFDMDLLRCNNYICHFFVVRTDLARKAGGFRDEFNGAQDHDFFFRCLENLPTSAIAHISKVLYHWRSHELSTAENPESKLYAYEAGKRAVTAHLERKHLKAAVTDTQHFGFFRVQYETGTQPVRIMTRTEWDALTKTQADQIPEHLIMILAKELTPLSSDYLSDLASYFVRYEVGAVGGKIYNKSGRVESAGFAMNEEGNFIPLFHGLNRHFSGYMHRASLQQRVDAVSLDCMMIRKSAIVFGEEKTMDERYLVVFDPYAEFRRKK